MQYILTAPAILNTAVNLPASKSISNRALILYALAQGATQPENLSDCDDTRVMIRALTGNAEVIDIMAAGTAMRFLTAYLSVTPGTHLITGTARMQQRPIRILVDALRTLGAQIAYAGNEGFPPLRITGTQLTGSEVSLPGSVSSQYISALLMIGATLPQGLVVHLTGDIVSRPYIDLTLQLMRDFGAKAQWTSADCITVASGGYRDTPFRVESDWSAASYWYEMAAVWGVLRKARKVSDDMQIELRGLFKDSCQGDCHGAELFARLGVRSEYVSQGVVLSGGDGSVSRLEADLLTMPDLAQTFVVTCCLMGISFRFTGLQSLKIKETDRLCALVTELRKLGYVVRAEQDCILRWEGERCEPDRQPCIDTYEDHRMAMAFAPASLVFPNLCINHPEVVSKSYPHYWDDLRKAGFSVRERNA